MPFQFDLNTWKGKGQSSWSAGSTFHLRSQPMTVKQKARSGDVEVNREEMRKRCRQQKEGSGKRDTKTLIVKVIEDGIQVRSQGTTWFLLLFFQKY